ncbi:hypothetical protein GF382_03760, partial [Candidatus Falkowbacteria bacterium]|nr:hypothetical protein [Candidatus Falkowbacteria bacterium]
MNLFNERSKKEKGHIVTLFLMGVLIFAAILTAQLYPLATFFIIVVIFSFFILSARLEWGLYLIAFFLPMINWHFVYQQFEIPFIDLLAIILLLSFFIRMLYERLSLNKIDMIWPLGMPFLVLFSALFISNLFSEYIVGSIWYSVRWVLFPYLAYIFVPVNIIK